MLRIVKVRNVKYVLETRGGLLAMILGTGVRLEFPAPYLFIYGENVKKCHSYADFSANMRTRSHSFTQSIRSRPVA